MLFFGEVVHLLEDKMREYEDKFLHAGGMNGDVDFYKLCLINLNKAYKALNDEVYFNRQIQDPYYQTNPDAAVVNPDQYVTQDDLQAAVNVMNEIKNMEYERIATHHGKFVVVGALLLGLVVGFVLGKKEKEVVTS